MSPIDPKAPPAPDSKSKASGWVRTLPSQPMTPQQQLEALRRVQLQAEQRVQLGNQLLDAAQARIAANQQILADVKDHTSRLRHELNQDLTDRLAEQDQRFDQFESRINRAIQTLERKVDALRDDWTRTQVQLGRLLRHTIPAPPEAVPPASTSPAPSATSAAPAAPPPSEDTPAARLYADLLQQLRHQAEAEPETPESDDSPRAE